MQSDNIGNLALALSKAQGTILTATFDAKNPFFKSKYASLTSVWNACRSALAENGLAVVQTTYHSGPDIGLTTTLIHESGEWISGDYPIMPAPDKNGVVTPQAVGSAISYARRYALSAIVGVVADDDDDGNGASQRTVQQPAQLQPMRKPPTRPRNGNGKPPAAVSIPGDALDYDQGQGDAHADDGSYNNPFSESEPWQEWNGAQDAYEWAISTGACANEFEARGSMRKIVEGVPEWAGRIHGGNKADVFLAFYERQIEKLSTETE